MSFRIKWFLHCSGLLLIFASTPSFSKGDGGIRHILLTDMAHDDPQSFIRLLYYSNVIDLEAIVITRFEEEPSDQHVMKKAMDRIDAYEEVYDLLLAQDSAYPSPSHLRSITKLGHGGMQITLKPGMREEDRFWDWVGEGNTPLGQAKDSEGSRHLLSLLEKEDDRPIFVQVWGGVLTFTQALYRYVQEHEEHEVEDLLSRLYFYTIHMQDIAWEYFVDMESPVISKKLANKGGDHGFYDGPRYPPERLYVDWGQFWQYFFLKDRPLPVPGHGPLSEYYLRGDEGDTPAMLILVSSHLGLNDPIAEPQGSWGGLFRHTSGMPPYYYETHDRTGVPDELVRWMNVANYDYLARLDYTDSIPGNENHNPLGVLCSDHSNQVLYKYVQPGQAITLSAQGSSDPDGNHLSYYWWQYQNADSYHGQIHILGENESMALVYIPEDLGVKDIHIILEVTDDGPFNLKSYRRIILSAADRIAGTGK
jgi:hypothetical protein